ncbi:hypothetical protein KDM41_03725 [bacterium]|nr:hypothetical protein [bacterium]
MSPRARILLVPVFAVTLLAALPARAAVAPALPYADLVHEVIGFLYSDVGWNGIRTNDDDPAGYPVPPYFYSYAINDGNNLDGSLVGYPGYLSVSYPGYTASVAIDAFLDWRRFSGDLSGEALARARAYADWILEHRTPAGDLYGNLPYSTQTDGVMGGGWDGPAIMTDKPPMFALRLLRLYDITGEAAYWNGAVEIADVMAATQLGGGAADDGRWPFRVVPSDGTVTQDYTSHLTPAIRFFDAMAARTGNAAYQDAADRAWAWLLANPGNPAAADYMRFEGFYEDQSPEMQTGFQDHYSGHEMLVELLRRRPAGWQDLAVTIWDSLSSRYLQESPSPKYDPYTPVTLEWSGWPEATYASSLQYARTALLLDQALAGDPRRDAAWRTTALDMAAACSHGRNTRKNDGRMFTTVRDIITYFNSDSWYEQNFNTVKYCLEIMALEPDLAPVGDAYILAADHALVSIDRPLDGPSLEYATAGGAGLERVKLPGAPGGVYAGAAPLPQVAGPVPATAGWSWDPATAVATIRHDDGPVAIVMGPTAVPETGAPGGPALRIRALSVPGGARALFAVDLARDGAMELAVYDLQGRRVRRLATGATWSAGTREIAWDGRDDHGRTVASGVYLVRGRSGGAEARARVLQIR